MTDKETILNVLNDHMADIREKGVKSLGLFGSIARGESTSRSDVDILIEFKDPIGLFEFIRVKQYLEMLTGRQVDLVTPDAIRPVLRDRILQEVIYVS